MTSLLVKRTTLYNFKPERFVSNASVSNRVGCCIAFQCTTLPLTSYLNVIQKLFLLLAFFFVFARFRNRKSIDILIKNHFHSFFLYKKYTFCNQLLLISIEAVAGFNYHQLQVSFIILKMVTFSFIIRVMKTHRKARDWTLSQQNDAWLYENQ